MTKKRKRYPDLNQKLERPWCYYCERDFDDLKILISHQKAKHFKCDRCGRRLNTAGGLSVHMNQVHKENLTHVENALPGRQGLEIEIFGMEGVPADHIDQHIQTTTQKHFAEEAERARLTGNPIRGQYTNGTAPPNKHKKVTETPEEVESRVDQWIDDRKNGVPRPTAMDLDPAQAATPFHHPQISPHPPNGSSIPPPRPSSIPGQSGPLPPRPTPIDPIQSNIDLIAGTGSQASEKKEKSKKDKNMRLIYNDESVSPEEKMALLPRFAEYVRV